TTQGEEDGATLRGIIQGPPGTGKSQTITNLIADFVARGKRVLFVCEKRAAIDVVYARLKQVGLDDLCCLIHDSQADKKEFVMGLKQTYEQFSSESDDHEKLAKRRGKTLASLRSNLQPLEGFDRVMQSTPPALGVKVRELVGRCVELRGLGPELDPVASERLPTYGEWVASGAAVERFEEALRFVGGEPVLARHPLRLLSGELAEQERPLERLMKAAGEATPHLERTEAELARCGVPREQWEHLVNAKVLTDYAERLSPLTDIGVQHVLDPGHEKAKQYDIATKSLSKSQADLAKASEAGKNWREPLDAEETETALEQAEMLEKSLLAWLRKINASRKATPVGRAAVWALLRATVESTGLPDAAASNPPIVSLLATAVLSDGFLDAQKTTSQSVVDR
ncbi:MAG: AAA domain-containing protein, partial [Planctomycetota bacterium]